MADTRTFRNYAESLQVGVSQYVVGANERRVPLNAQGLPAGGTTGQAMIKLSDEDYDAGWTGAFIQSIVQGTGITIDATDPRNPIISADAAESGDVDGPEEATDGHIAVFDGETGKLIADGGKLISELQPASTDLTAIAALVSAANKLPYATGAGTWAMTDFSAFGRTLVDDADASTARTTLGVVIGTDVQAYDADTAKTDVAQQFSKPQRASATPVTSATTMTIDLAANNDFEVTDYQHNGTLANPNNQSTQINQKGTITITQDGSGGHTLSFGSNWKAIGSASAPSINTTAGVTSCIDYHVLSSTVIRYSLRAVGAA